MVPEPVGGQAGAMDTSTEHPQSPPEGRHEPGPRVSSDELRNLAALRRSRSDKKIAGVAGGLSRHLDIDPLITRVALVVLVFFGGAGLILYAAGWLLVPLEGEDRATVRLDDRSRTVALALVGVLAALSLLGDSLGGFGFPWPLAVIGSVVVLVMLVRGRNDHPAPVPSPMSMPYPPPAPPAASARRRRRGPVLFWYTLALIAIGIGVLASLDLGGVAVVDSAYPALALITSALMLVLGAFWGRPGGLIALGLVSAVATAAATAGGQLDVGQVERRPVVSSSLASDYSLDAGEIVIDLRELTDPEALDGRTVTLDVGLGRVEVIVTDDITVTVASDLGAGDSSIFGTTGDGGRDLATVAASVAVPADAPALTLDVHVGLGDIQITREEATR